MFSFYDLLTSNQSAREENWLFGSAENLLLNAQAQALLC
jgi:hypothetical protein